MTPSRAPLRFLGTWRIKQCESSQPELAHPTSGVTSFTQEGDVVHYENQSTWSDGRSSQVSASLRLDGSWCPVNGSSLTDSVSFRSNGDSFEATMRQQDKPAGSNRTRVSPTGRTMTSEWEIPTPDGQTIVWKMIFERE